MYTVKKRMKRKIVLNSQRESEQMDKMKNESHFKSLWKVQNKWMSPDL